MPFLFFKSTCYLNGGMWSPLQNSDTLFFYNVSDQHQKSSHLVGSIATLTSHQRLPFKSTCCSGGIRSHIQQCYAAVHISLINPCSNFAVVLSVLAIARTSRTTRIRSLSPYTALVEGVPTG